MVFGNAPVQSYALDEVAGAVPLTLTPVPEIDCRKDGYTSPGPRVRARYCGDGLRSPAASWSNTTLSNVTDDAWLASNPCSCTLPSVSTCTLRTVMFWKLGTSTPLVAS